MDIQGYIVDYWKSRMDDKHPVLTIYDPSGQYRSLLEMAEQSGIKVFDTSSALLQTRLEATEFWSKSLVYDANARMILYRSIERPGNKRAKVSDPYSGISAGSTIFPDGPKDSYINLCKSFLPNKWKEIDKLEAQGTISFANVNALQDGANYPELENLTKEKSPIGITIGLLNLQGTENLLWQNEWASLAAANFPGLEATGMSLKSVQQKLWQYLLFSEFVLDLPVKLPAALKSVPVAPKEIKETIFAICRRIRNAIDMRELYVNNANHIMDSLKLNEIFGNESDLGEIVTFSFENNVEFERLIHYLQDAEVAKASLLVQNNKKDVWYQASRHVEAFWHLAEQACELYNCILSGIKSEGSLQGILKWYTSEGYKADLAFRKFHTRLQTLDYSSKAIGQLEQMVNASYRDFTERVVKEYQSYAEAKGLKGDLGIKRNLTSFHFVKEDLDAGKKVVMVMADAFRYEMGKDFEKNISTYYETECCPAFAYLPTVTRFGMAALLPDADNQLYLRIVSEKVQPFIGEDSIILPADRINYMKKVLSVSVFDASLDTFSPEDIPADIRLLVVRSSAIDSAGENSGIKGFQTMVAETQRFARLLEECKGKGFDVVYFFADHGYMMQSSFKPGDNISAPMGTVYLNERRCQAGDINDSPNTISMAPSFAGFESDLYKIAFARNFAVFKAGITYFHEGLSPQENVVPVVKVKLTKDIKQSNCKITLTYKGLKSGEIYIQRPFIEINSEFYRLFDDPVFVKMDIRDKSGNTIGEVVESPCYNDTTKILTIHSTSAKLKQPIELKEDYAGDVVVTIYDAETGKTLDVLNLKADIS